MDLGQLAFSELLLDGDVSPVSLCKRALSKAMKLLSEPTAHSDTGSCKEDGRAKTESILQSLQMLAVFLNRIEAEDLVEIGSSCFHDVCVPYLRWLSSEQGSLQQYFLATALKTVAMVLSSLMEKDRVMQTRIIEWFVEIVNSELCIQRSFQSEERREADSAVSSAVVADEPTTMTCSIVLPVLQFMLESSGVQRSSDCFNELFEALLNLVVVCESSATFFHISSTLLPLFITNRGFERLKKVWELIKSVHSSKTTVESSSLELVLTLLCCLHDVFLGCDDSSPFSSAYPTSLFESTGGHALLDLRKEEDFWSIVQDGLTSPDPLSRKRCMYLLHCVLVSVQRCGGGEEEEVSCGKWVFWWDTGSAKQLQAVWNDLVLVLETLEEKQVLKAYMHLIIGCSCEILQYLKVMWNKI